MPKAIQQSPGRHPPLLELNAPQILPGRWLSQPATVGPKVLEKTVSFLRCWDIADRGSP
jgi:hypothetical protein